MLSFHILTLTLLKSVSYPNPMPASFPTNSIIILTVVFQIHKKCQLIIFFSDFFRIFQMLNFTCYYWDEVHGDWLNLILESILDCCWKIPISPVLSNVQVLAPAGLYLSVCCLVKIKLLYPLGYFVAIRKDFDCYNKRVFESHSDILRDTHAPLPPTLSAIANQSASS